MKTIVIAENKKNAEELSKCLQIHFSDKMTIETISLSPDNVGTIQNAGADLLVTVNLAGFDTNTFTDSVSYNLLSCKQIHILWDKHLSNEKVLRHPLSIAMFFVCVGMDYQEYLLEKYPDIPWLKGVEDEDAVYEIIREIIGLIDTA